MRKTSNSSQPAADVTAGPFSVSSTILGDEAGSATPEQAFRDRLHAVQKTRGLRGLQVRREANAPGRNLMAWWESRDHFHGYVQSAEHHTSQARILNAPARPRPAAREPSRR